MVAVIGHRGARAVMPENTLAGFRYAAGLGIDGVELDVGMTADGVVVVHHDRRLSPDTTRGPDGEFLRMPGPTLAELDRAALAPLDVGRLRPGSESARRFPDQRAVDGEPIPTLAEALAVLSTTLRLFVEVKTSPLAPAETAAPEALARAVASLLRDAGATERATVIAFDWRVLRHARALGLRTGCLSIEVPGHDTIHRNRGESPWTDGFRIAELGTLPAMARAADASWWCAFHLDLGPGDVDEAHALGLQVAAWTVNAPDRMRELAALGVDALVTDDPEGAREVLQPQPAR